MQKKHQHEPATIFYVKYHSKLDLSLLPSQGRTSLCILFPLAIPLCTEEVKFIEHLQKQTKIRQRYQLCTPHKLMQFLQKHYARFGWDDRKW